MSELVWNDIDTVHFGDGVRHDVLQSMQIIRDSYLSCVCI